MDCERCDIAMEIEAICETCKKADALTKERDKLLTHNAVLATDALKAQAEVAELDAEIGVLTKSNVELVVERNDALAELAETEDALVDTTKLFAKAVEENRWIPVSEGLPKDEFYRELLCCGRVFEGFWDIETKILHIRTHDNRRVRGTMKITHYRMTVSPETGE